MSSIRPIALGVGLDAFDQGLHVLLVQQCSGVKLRGAPGPGLVLLGHMKGSLNISSNSFSLVLNWLP